MVLLGTYPHATRGFLLVLFCPYADAKQFECCLQTNHPENQDRQMRSLPQHRIGIANKGMLNVNYIFMPLASSLNGFSASEHPNHIPLTVSYEGDLVWDDYLLFHKTLTGQWTNMASLLECNELLCKMNFSVK